MQHLFLALILMGSVVASAKEPIKYPYTAISIRCLQLDEQTHLPLVDKYVEILKIYANPTDFDYTVSAGIHTDTMDYGTVAEPKPDAVFEHQDDVFKMRLQVTAATRANFENAELMEPFIVDYRFDSDFLNNHDSFQLKCLHRIF